MYVSAPRLCRQMRSGDAEFEMKFLDAGQGDAVFRPGMSVGSFQYWSLVVSCSQLTWDHGN